MPAIQLGVLWFAQVTIRADRLNEAAIAAQSRDFCPMAALLEDRQRYAIVVLHAWLEESHSVQLASTKTDSQSHLEI